MGRTELETCDIILISWDSVKSEMIFEIKARLDEEILNLTRTFNEVNMKDLLSKNKLMRRIVSDGLKCGNGKMTGGQKAPGDYSQVTESGSMLGRKLK